MSCQPGGCGLSYRGLPPSHRPKSKPSGNNFWQEFFHHFTTSRYQLPPNISYCSSILRKIPSFCVWSRTLTTSCSRGCAPRSAASPRLALNRRPWTSYCCQPCPAQRVWELKEFQQERPAYSACLSWSENTRLVVYLTLWHTFARHAFTFQFTESLPSMAC